MSIKRLLLIPELDYECLKRRICNRPEDPEPSAANTSQVAEAQPSKAIEGSQVSAEPQEDLEEPLDPTTTLVNAIPLQFRHCALDLLARVNSEGSLKIDPEGQLWLSGQKVPELSAVQFLRLTCVPFTPGALPNELKVHLQRCRVHKVRNHECSLKKPWTPLVFSPASTKTTQPKASEAPSPSTSRPRRKASKYR